ncbi:GNAT family N-acetyltransferase [Microbispora sp. NPDC049125]|uniref:GNAT family N-acetyltransferase n=1 Tax=Microbispora sp. NPDC049125 TaxID=3154929 RepID=UPI003467494F
MTEIATERLVLRRWRHGDRQPFAALNADPAVMEHFPSTLSRAESDALAGRIEAAFAERGFGLWAVEAGGAFIGFTGLNVPRFTAHFTPCVEIGWRLARPAWGHGYATEAARAALAYGFGELGLAEIVSFTSVTNVRSQAVMRRIGMTRDPQDDFDHPALDEDSPLRRHVLYRISAPAA